MQRCLKNITILIVLLLSLSLIGCSHNSSQEKQSKKEVKTAETVKKMPQKASIKPVDQKKGKTASIQKTSQNTLNEVKNTAPTTQKPKTVADKQTGPVEKKTVTSPTVPKKTTKPNTVKNTVPVQTVTFSIMGPKDKGTILPATKVSIKDGDTILQVLLHAASSHSPKLVVDYTGSGAMAYVQGIDNIYEFDYGAKSGWLFKQNGVSLTKSVGVTNIKAGDRIECYYTQ